MGKYANLGQFLREQKRSAVPMTFAEVEKVTGHPLPHSARYPAWWSNNPSNNVMTKIWLEAGFKTEQVDISSKKVVFRKVESEETAREAAVSGNEGYYPFYGSMKGLIRIEPGVDITKPADPEWGTASE